MKNTKTMKKAVNHTVAIEIGVAALAAAAAGAYFLYGSTKGPARRRALKSWMVKMKGDVMDEVENLKEISEESYYSAIDKVSKKYQALKNIDPKELESTIKRLKGHWKDIKKELKA